MRLAPDVRNDAVLLRFQLLK